MITKAMCKQQFYIEDTVEIHVVTHKIMYINVLNLSKFFLAEFEEMKNCLYRAKAGNDGMGL